MKPAQPLKVVNENYSVLAVLEALHKRMNDVVISPAVANLKTDYAAGDLGTAAEIAAAFNLTNGAINQILAKINLS